jgi:hypothetical protein
VLTSFVAVLCTFAARVLSLGTLSAVGLTCTHPTIARYAPHQVTAEIPCIDE